MDSKKRLMFILEDDYYYITLKVLAILKALGCEEKPFEDYRKLGIIFEFIKSQANFLFFKKIMDQSQLEVFDNERAINISCNAKMNTTVIKRVLFFLEKQKMISMKRSLKGDYIDIFLQDTLQLNELMKENILNEDLNKVSLIRSNIPRVRWIKISTLRKKIFGTSEVALWED